MPEDILKIKQDTEAEFFGEDQNWGHSESNVSSSKLSECYDQ